MSIFAYFAALAAVANCVGLLSPQFAPYHAYVFLVALLLGVLGFIMPGKEKTEGRVVSILAVVLAFLPLVREPVRAFRTKMKERAYARQIAPALAEWAESSRAFAPQIEAYHKKNGMFPEEEEGKLVAAPGAPPPSFALPTDPFEKDGKSLRYWTDAAQVWATVSHGPDKAFDLNAPPRAPVGEKADWRGRWIVANPDNPDLLRYDPTNGALGKGDLVIVNGSKEDTTAYFAALSKAWVEARQKASGGNAGETLAHRWSLAASELLKADRPLAALAAARQSIKHIPIYPKDQKPVDYLGWFVQGEALYALGDARMAAASLVEYTKLASNDPTGYYRLGSALYYLGDLKQARQALSAAAQIEPKHPIAAAAQNALDAMTKGNAPPLDPPGRLRDASGPTLPARAPTPPKEEPAGNPQP